MKKHVIFFEARGGSDKGPDGHRRDTMPMVNAVKAQGWEAEIIFYSDEKKDEIYDYVVATAAAYVSRINPGNIPGGEETYFDMLRALCDAGVVGMPHPDAMIGYGAKDALTRLTDTELVPDDTFAYYTVEEFKKVFPSSVSHGVRVLKQNRGSTGEGIWRVEVVDERPCQPGDTLPLDTQLKCTEAVDNHVEINQLGDFMLDWDENMQDKYILGEINCSCVGFTSHLEHGIQEKVAAQIIETVTAANNN